VRVRAQVEAAVMKLKIEDFRLKIDRVAPGGKLKIGDFRLKIERLTAGAVQSATCNLQPAISTPSRFDCLAPGMDHRSVGIEDGRCQIEDWSHASRSGSIFNLQSSICNLAALT